MPQDQGRRARDSRERRLRACSCRSSQLTGVILSCVVGAAGLSLKTVAGRFGGGDLFIRGVPESFVSGGAAPLEGLSRHGCDAFEVAIAVEQGQSLDFGGCGDDQVDGTGAAALAPFRQFLLDLPRPGRMRGRRPGPAAPRVGCR